MREARRRKVGAVDHICTACQQPRSAHTLAIDVDGRVVAIVQGDDDTIACADMPPAAGWTFTWTRWLDVVDGSRTRLCFAKRNGGRDDMVGAVSLPGGARRYVAEAHDWGGYRGELHRGSLSACMAAVRGWATGEDQTARDRPTCTKLGAK